MKKRKNKKNPVLSSLLVDIKKNATRHDSGFWRDVYERLQKPSRQMPVVNVGKIASLQLQKDEVIVVPGKLLGNGNIDKPVTVYAYKASRQAIQKIEAAKGKYGTLRDLLRDNPQGKNVRIIA